MDKRDRRDLLKDDIDRSREELIQAVEELRLAAKDPLSLRQRIADNPTPWLVGGFVFGFWLGTR